MIQLTLESRSAHAGIVCARFGTDAQPGCELRLHLMTPADTSGTLAEMRRHYTMAQL